MKNKVCLFMSLVLWTSVSFGATSLNWQSNMATGDSSTYPDVVDLSGGAVPQYSDWYLQLYDVSYSSWDPVSNPQGGELFSTTSAFQTMAGAVLIDTGEIYPWASGKTLGTRLYNNTDPAAATHFALGASDKSIQTLEGNENDPRDIDYNFATIDQSSWVAVPEPATALFGLVGLVTLAIARRRKQLQS